MKATLATLDEAGMPPQTSQSCLLLSPLSHEELSIRMSFLALPFKHIWRFRDLEISTKQEDVFPFTRSPDGQIMLAVQIFIISV